MTADAVGGVWQYSLDLARGLADRGCEILLAVLGPAPSKEQQQAVAELPHIDLATAPYALEWMDNPWDDVEQSKHWLLDLANTLRPDVVHLNGYALADAPWRAPAIVVAHSCVLSWWQAVHNVAAPLVWTEYERQVRRGLHVASAVVAPSRHLATSIASIYGLEPNDLIVIPNFSLIDHSTHVAKEPFILAAGRVWDKAKNIALLESISSDLAWPVAIAGDASGPREVNGKRVRHLGCLSHSDLCEQMGRAAIFAHPAFYEPFGLSVLEAARAGCCVMLADIPSLRELWGDAAVFASPHEPAAWIQTLNEFARNESLRQTMSRRAIAHALRYSARAAVDQYFALYERLLNSADRKPGAAA